MLAEIATGKSSAAIAESLFLTKRAVEKHINSILWKLDLPDTHAVSRRVKATLLSLAEDESYDSPHKNRLQETMGEQLSCSAHAATAIDPPQGPRDLRESAA